MLLVIGLVACAGRVESSVHVTPAAPAPAAVHEPADATTATEDADGDGIVAGDTCPEEAETENGFEDTDGCPDEAPDFYATEEEIRYTGTLAFGLLGGLKNESKPVVAGIASVLKKQPDIELVDVGAHVTAGGDEASKSEKRAKALVAALVDAGVDTKRLKASGYGKRCPDGGDRIELKVLRRSGKDTNVSLCP
jgi:outer membrane protein OmpA-like peptidoglycan-associated protein